MHLIYSFRKNSRTETTKTSFFVSCMNAMWVFKPRLIS